MRSSSARGGVVGAALACVLLAQVVVTVDLGRDPQARVASRSVSVVDPDEGLLQASVEVRNSGDELRVISSDVEVSGLVLRDRSEPARLERASSTTIAFDVAADCRSAAEVKATLLLTVETDSAQQKLVKADVTPGIAPLIATLQPCEAGNVLEDGDRPLVVVDVSPLSPATLQVEVGLSGTADRVLLDAVTAAGLRIQPVAKDSNLIDSTALRNAKYVVKVDSCDQVPRPDLKVQTPDFPFGYLRAQLTINGQRLQLPVGQDPTGSYLQAVGRLIEAQCPR